MNTKLYKVYYHDKYAEYDGGNTYEIKVSIINTYSQYRAIDIVKMYYGNVKVDKVEEEEL